jgi:PAS domain S-box-containing protein
MSHGTERLSTAAHGTDQASSQLLPLAYDDERRQFRCAPPASGGQPDAQNDRRARPPEWLDEQYRFEKLLVDLSAGYVNLPADQVDAQIEETQRRLVEFLGVDRCSFGEFAEEKKELRVTHSYVVPGLPPFPRIVLDDQYPWYTEKIRQGEALCFERLPADLPPEATVERELCVQTGFKSHLAIPLKVGGSLLCVLTFGSLRDYRRWPDELVQRIRLVGEILANAVARKRADIALRESEGRFRLLADAAPVMVWMSGPEKLCTYFNKHWLDFTGRPLLRELGDGWSAGVHPDDLPRCLRIYVQAFDARQPFRMEYRLRRFDGEYRWILDTGVPRFQSDGAFEGYIGSCIDITDQKRVEETLRAREQSLRSSQDDLRALASQLLQAQEQERRRIAREMHDDWTQRLAVLAIDAVKLERQLGAPDTALRLLTAMREQMVALSEDVHDLSRQLHPSILDDLGLVEALRSECASFARREEIAIDYRPGSVAAGLPMDVALCIYRVAQEALRNIAKHAKADFATVALGGDDRELILTVQDRGVGFDMGSIRSLPGIGLSSMRERVRLIDAELSIQSAPNDGTTVTVRVALGPQS